MTGIPTEADEAENERHREKARKHKAARDKIMATKTIEKGLLIVHTGKGKGKSTAAFGMVFRMLGHGLSTYDAARAGAWLCGRAAELAITFGGESEESLSAGRLRDHLGGAFKELRTQSY